MDYIMNEVLNKPIWGNPIGFILFVIVIIVLLIILYKLNVR